MPTTERPGWPEHGRQGPHDFTYKDDMGNPRCGGCGISKKAAANSLFRPVIDIKATPWYPK